MTRSLLLFLLLQIAAAPAALGLDQALAARLRELSAETFLDAIAYELRKDPAAGPALDALPPGAAAAAAAGPAATQAALFDAAAALVPAHGLPPEGRAAARRAIDEARAYLAPSGLPAWQESPLPAKRKPPPGLAVYRGGAPEISASDPADLRWKDADGYAASRLGPLTAVLDGLGPRDRIVLSNLPPGRLPARVLGRGRLLSLNLPVSGYAKTLWLLEGADGRRTLLLGDFQGASFLRHFELLVKRRYAGKKAPSITVAEHRAAYEPYYRALTGLRAANPGALDGLEGLAAGYAESFRLYWSSWSVSSASDAAGDWRVDIYNPPGAGLWGVISARSSYYGETLGMNIRYLVEESTGIRTVLIAGSGGSLDPRPLYSITYPSHVLATGGRPVPNALASRADYTAHVSVHSPLEETPAWTRAALRSGAGTVDVEMAQAAGALSGLGLRLGFAVLVTDFPADRPVFARALERASLARQDPALKYRGLAAYARGVEEWLRGGAPPGWQPIEKKLGRTLAEQSALNLRAARAGLAPLSAEEERLLRRLEKYFAANPPSFSVRMSTPRAARALEDEALLSTGLVAALKGTAVTPFTPGYEDAAYGAYDYLFGTLSYWDGPERYGPAVLRLGLEAWQRRAWATRRSAMRALAMEAEAAGLGMEAAAADSETVKKAEARFASWIMVPRDLPGALALQVTEELRALPPAAAAEFAAARDREIPALITRHDVGWLEGKIWKSARVEELELVKAPSPYPAGIAGPAARLGLRLAPTK